MNVGKRMISLAAMCLPCAFLPQYCGFQTSAAESVRVEIPVICSEVTEYRNHVYTIKIKPENEYCPEPLSDTLRMKGDETGFFIVDIDSPGTFYYKIYESAGEKEEIFYDDSVYTVALFVENDDDAGLSYSLVANVGENEKKSDKITFADLVKDPAKKEDENITTSETTKLTTTSAGKAMYTTTTTATVTAAFADANEVSSTVVSEISSTVSSELGSTAETQASSTTSTSSAAAAAEGGGDRTFTGFLGSVLTGDSFPAHTLRITMLAAFLTAFVSFILKRRDSEEVEENEK